MKYCINKRTIVGVITKRQPFFLVFLGERMFLRPRNRAKFFFVALPFSYDPFNITTLTNFILYYYLARTINLFDMYENFLCTNMFFNIYWKRFFFSHSIICISRYKKHSAAKDLSTKSAAELKSIFGKNLIFFEKNNITTVSSLNFFQFFGPLFLPPFPPL